MTCEWCGAEGAVLWESPVGPMWVCADVVPCAVQVAKLMEEQRGKI